jgi:hypothetical protein
MGQPRPRGITVVAVFMIVAGLGEVATGFTHEFFSLRIAQGTMSTYAGVAIGVLYTVAGLLALTMNKRAAAFSFGLLIVVVAGRIAMVATGLYPMDSLRQVMAIIAGTSLAAGCAIYIGLKGLVFR